MTLGLKPIAPLRWRNRADYKHCRGGAPQLIMSFTGGGANTKTPRIGLGQKDSYVNSYSLVRKGECARKLETYSVHPQASLSALYDIEPAHFADATVTQMQPSELGHPPPNMQDITFALLLAIINLILCEDY
jgi:hypothetical protein